jgi:MYXO-CTERM domain-containing protein
MNIHDGRQAFVDACVELGVDWDRLDGNWFQMQPSSNSYNWFLDDAVNRANAAGLKVFITLAYTPQWAARSGDTDGQFLNDVPTNTAQWTAFVSAAVTHYRAMGVTHFGMWNEPNLKQFFEGSVSQYAQLIAIPGAAAVRAACADCKVLGPDLANVGDADDYLEAVFDALPLDTFDIVAHHIYQGFPETGTSVFDGDRYFNVLDSQRFPGFTRRSLRQLLDDAGWTGEVWITETGYKAKVNDNNDEQTQATYVTLALGEQLKRDWVTNTFFYEIHDCGVDEAACTIDGFGLMRATAGSPISRRFPQDFRLKPAFDALKRYIAEHPEFSALPPSSACNDGLDNDGDHAIDMNDLGCSSVGDDDESDEAAPPTLFAMPATTLVLDGSLDDFGDEAWVELLPTEAWRGLSPVTDSADSSARFAARWSASALYLAVEVDDELHENTRPASELWMADSVQLAFDVGNEGGFAYDTLNDHELNFGLSNGAVLLFRFHGPNGASDAFEAQIRREGSTTRYEIRIQNSALPGLRLEQGTRLGFSLLVNDADGAGREGWLEWTSGIGSGKAPSLFGDLLLVAQTPPLDEDPEQLEQPEDEAAEELELAEQLEQLDDSEELEEQAESEELSAELDTFEREDEVAESTLEPSPTQAANDDCSCALSTDTPSPAPGVAVLVVFGVFLLRRRR